MIAIYCRVSTTEQAEHGYSIKEQEDRLRSYCDALGLGKPKAYIDAGHSGAKIDRPSLQLLIHDVKLHKIDKVIVYKLDRLSRSQKDTLTLIEDVFLANGCDFVSISENFDTSTPLGRAMIGILAVFAQLEREQIKERMTMGREARAKQGKYAGSWLHPIGYDYIDGELIVNEFEKAQIIQIYNDYLSGMTYRAIAKRLNDSGLTHKYGKWRAETVRTTLERKTYIGYVRFGEDWYKGHHEPIIDEDLFYKVQNLKNRNYTAYMDLHRRAGRPTSYLGGLLVCKQCGQKYYKKATSSGAYKYDYYVCLNRLPKSGRGFCKNRYWRTEELDEIIFSEIRKLSFSRKRRKTPVTPPAISAKIKELDKQLERLMSLYALDEVPLDTLQKKIQEISEQKQKLETIPDEPRTPIEEAEEIVTSFDEILEKGSFDDIRKALGTLIDKIELDGDDIYIYWAFE